jgi:mycothiol synthase
MTSLARLREPWVWHTEGASNAANEARAGMANGPAGDGPIPEWRFRALTRDDVQAVSDLVAAYEDACFGFSDWSIDDQRQEWADPSFTLGADALVATAAGQIVGYVAFWNRAQHVRYTADGYAHPRYQGRGLGTALLRWSEARVRERLELAPAGVQVTLDHGTAGTDAAAAQLFAREGYVYVRSFLEMSIVLDGPPPAPEWPPGIAASTFVPGADDYSVYAAATEAFGDHWGHATIPFEEWRVSRLEFEGFDPSLSCVARAGDEVAGQVRCRMRAEKGWVDHLSVRRRWRGQGLGLALLRHAFGSFYRRGVREVGLGVDAESPTGATRLYERAGMSVERRYDMYRKVLRPGREPE